MTRRWLARSAYGPRRLRRVLGLTGYQMDRAIRDGIIPRPDAPRGRWRRTTVRELTAALTPAVRASLGSVPDLGAVAAADWLSRHLVAIGEEEFAYPVHPDTVRQLGYVELLGQVAECSAGHVVFSGRDLEWFGNQPPVALVDQLLVEGHNGRMRSLDEAAWYLGIRRVDVEHLIRAGYLMPARVVTDEHGCPTPLYRTFDLSTLEIAPDFDWESVRSTPAGDPSPFRHLPSWPASAGTEGGHR